jgi:hypothetical protein
VTPARASAIFPFDARRKPCGKLIQQVPSGAAYARADLDIEVAELARE